MHIPYAEIKRKLFHNLSLIYVAAYGLLPRTVTLAILGVALLAVGVIEFLRLRRPELNAWFLGKFGGIHREAEVLKPSGIFWTLFGCWLTMLIFDSRRVVLPALGTLAFADTAAALCGKTWGKHPIHWNADKTYEGSAAFVVAAVVWSLAFRVRWHVALIAALVTAYFESRKLRWNDNFWIPLISALSLSVLNLTLGKH
jgi:dolichol kinase